MTKPKVNPSAALLGTYGASSTPITQSALDTAFPEAPIEKAARQVVADIGRKYALVSIESIRPNPLGNPRQTIDQDKLKSLAKSIKEDGLLEPVILRESSEPGIYELAAGERRWRAAMMAGLEEIPAEILDECSDSKLRRIALIENLLRENLTPYELALAYKDLLDERDEQGKKVYIIQSLADSIHQTKDHVDSHLAILRVPEKVRQLIIEDPAVPIRIIREIGGVENSADQDLLIAEVRARSLNQADIIAILQEQGQGKKRKLKEPSEEKQEEASPIARAIFLRKFQTQQEQFNKSLGQVSASWGKLDTEGRKKVHELVRQRIDLMEDLLTKHPIDLSV